MCEGNNKNFVVINQKGIDPLSLDMMAKEGIVALRRAKRRNMERYAILPGDISTNVSYSHYICILMVTVIILHLDLPLLVVVWR